jgi:transposase InsO family protein
VQLDFIRPGKPVENAFIDASNGRPRAECVNVHQFTSSPMRRRRSKALRVDYNQRRPHSSLGHLTSTSSPNNVRTVASKTSLFLAQTVSLRDQRQKATASPSNPFSVDFIMSTVSNDGLL